MIPEPEEWNIETCAQEVEGRIASRANQAFLADVRKLLQVLDRVGESNWKSEFVHVEWLLSQGATATAAEVALSPYGGMGSFNDLFISPLNGHVGDATILLQAEKEISILRARIHQHAIRASSLQH